MRLAHQIAILLVSFGIIGAATAIVSKRAAATPNDPQTPDLVMIALAFGPSLRLEPNDAAVARRLASGRTERVYRCISVFGMPLVSIGFNCRRAITSAHN
ncbi:MAG: hypothetical protein AAF732_14505 [Pseudomonadota bacterium]